VKQERVLGPDEKGMAVVTQVKPECIEEMCVVIVCGERCKHTRSPIILNRSDPSSIIIPNSYHTLYHPQQHHAHRITTSLTFQTVKNWPPRARKSSSLYRLFQKKKG
jgi:hypothetical protein